MTSSIQTNAPVLPFTRELSSADFNRLCQLLRLYFVRLDNANLATSLAIDILSAVINEEGMNIQKKQLGQTSPSTTSATLLYSPPVNTTWIGETLIVCNTSGSATTFRVYHDISGATYDATKAIFYDVSIAGNSTLTYSKVLAGGPGGNVAVRTNTANALTFTLYGTEYL